MSTFQIKLSGAWSNYEKVEDKILKRAFMAGFPNAKFELRGQHYQYDFSKMVQRNLGTGKEREIRAPHKWVAPKKPIVPAGPTMAVNVPKGKAGRTIRVPHPKCPDQFIIVKVPRNAKAGQTMMVPVPPVELFAKVTPSAPTPSALEAPAGAVAAAPTPAKPTSKKGGWSTGAKVAAGVAGAGVVVGGAILGAEVAEHGWEATADGIGDAFSAGVDAAGDMAGDAGDALEEFAGDAGEVLGDAGEAIGDFAVEAGDFFVDAGESAGDFIMDLF